MIVRLFLPDGLRAQISNEARAAFPRECCGLIEGRRDGDATHAVALHPARNLSGDADRFEVDPADHFAAVRIARAREHVIVGCYHSHPGGVTQPSERDRAGAEDENFLWLICGGGGSEIQAFVFVRGDFQAAEIVADGAAI